MQKCCAHKPRHKRRILHRIPEPEPSPAQFVIGPVRAHRDANGQKYPSCQRPWTHPTCPSSIDATFDKSSDREGKSDREPDIPEIEKRWVNCEADVLQDRVEIASFKRSLWQSEERIGCEEYEQIKGARD